jgi:DNA invertase Pin-like site-specific DNA recombinase
VPLPDETASRDNWTGRYEELRRRVIQSTLRQVLENTESTKRQYALRERAVALGWPVERIVVIDHDLGQSGASAADREGFQRLVSEVGLGRAGIVLGLEVSRLARNCADWHRLLEICALSYTLILDEDGLYDPTQFNDRLLLGLKGAMSEAELHVLGARLQGGIRNKARRGDLKLPLPVGLVYDPQDRVALDPDLQVQQALHTFFQAYERTGSAIATVKFFRRESLLFPRRLRRGLDKGRLVWGRLVHSRALQVLHNPRYAGAFVFGRSRQRKKGDGHVDFRRLPLEEWDTLLVDAHSGYITWQQFQEHQQRLRDAAQKQGADRRHSPPGEGPALLQGLVMCGRCGQRMTVRYHRRRDGLAPEYVCQRDGIERAEGRCQTIPGSSIDERIGNLLLLMMTPVTLEVALAVQQELQGRIDEVDRLRRQQVPRARYEADLARHRYMQVDPNNRLVADSLEADWNDKLRALNDVQQQCQQQSQGDRAVVDETVRSEILSLATDFPRLWRDPRTSDRDRKRMVRLLVEDVTLVKADEIAMQVRFKGGTTHALTVPLPRNASESWQTHPDIVARIDGLLAEYTETEIATQLNEQGLRSGKGRKFTHRLVGNVRRGYHLKSRYDRLREGGLLTATEMAADLGVCKTTVHAWHHHGLLRGHAYNAKEQYLFDPVEHDQPAKQQGHKRSERRPFTPVVVNRIKVVQDEA